MRLCTRVGLWVFCVIGVFVSVPAVAQAPVLSNVTIVQGPNGPAGTKVDVTYDLASPAGPCTVSVKLSEDGGGTFPLTLPTEHLSGDVGAGIAAGTGKHIVWDVTADYPNQDMPNRVIMISADETVNQSAPVVT